MTLGVRFFFRVLRLVSTGVITHLLLRHHILVLLRFFIHFCVGYHDPCFVLLLLQRNESNIADSEAAKNPAGNFKTAAKFCSFGAWRLAGCGVLASQ
jgi:hypothetical protein